MTLILGRVNICQILVLPHTPIANDNLLPLYQKPFPYGENEVINGQQVGHWKSK